MLKGTAKGENNSVYSCEANVSTGTAGYREVPKIHEREGQCWQRRAMGITAEAWTSVSVSEQHSRGTGPLGVRWKEWKQSPESHTNPGDLTSGQYILLKLLFWKGAVGILVL